MRVLQLGPYPPPEGGINRNMLAVRDELCKIGHQCLIIATAKSSKITPEPYVYHPRTPLELIKLLLKLNCDVLHLHIGGNISRRILGLMAACAFFGRGKSVLTLHSGGYALENHKTAKPRSLAGMIFRQFKKIICVNALMIEMFERFGVKTEKLHLIYPFVLQSPDETVKVPSALEEFAEKHKPFLLAVCLLEDTYDLFMQIDSMGKVLREFPDAGLMIVGSGSLEDELKEAIAAKPYSQNILLTGDVEHKITLHLINKADVLLRTTLYDGDAIAVREAMHLETPVIATDNKMRPEGIRLIPMHDEEALIEAIGDLAAQSKKTKTEKPDDRSNIAEVLKVYEKVLAEK
jgi:glycosyltransferase involved in cell wall biosynthesis